MMIYQCEECKANQPLKVCYPCQIKTLEAMVEELQEFMGGFQDRPHRERLEARIKELRVTIRDTAAWLGAGNSKRATETLLKELRK